VKFEAGPTKGGGFGDVRKAKLMQSSDVAIKVCRDVVGKQSMSALALQNEIRLFRRIRHTNIVLFYGVTVIQGGILGLVLEWVDGGNFGEFVTRRHKSGDYERDCGGEAMSLPEWKLLEDIARGLAYLHSQTPPILHRDLKPANVLVEASKPPKAKLTDFGLSVLMSEGREVHTRAGTGSYMAPEVNARSAYGVAADLYSFGCVVVFSAMARSPPAGGVLQAAEALRSSDVGSSAMIDLAIECLQADPSLRPRSAEALARIGTVRSGGEVEDS